MGSSGTPVTIYFAQSGSRIREREAQQQPNIVSIELVSRLNGALCRIVFARACATRETADRPLSPMSARRVLAPGLGDRVGYAVPAACALCSHYGDSLHHLRVTKPAQRLAGKDVYCVLAPLPCSCGRGHIRATSYMRGNRQVFEIEQRTLGIQRLNLGHIDSGSDNLVSLKRFLQSCFIDDRTTCAVDEYRRRLHFSECINIENMIRFCGRWRMDSQVVRLCK